MALELIVNLLLIAGGIFCFVNVSTSEASSRQISKNIQTGRYAKER